MNITNREKEVLNLISYGYTFIDIAHMLYISTETVKTHVKNLNTKLNTGKSQYMVRKGFELGILSC